MLVVSGFKQTENKEGKPFCQLILQGELELIQSKVSKRFYASAKICTIASSFSPEICSSLIGRTIPGSIKKVECPEYEYKIPGSTEILTLNYRWDYVPEDREMEEQVFEKKSSNTLIKSSK